MEEQFAEHFISQWARYFPNAGLPITYFYTDQPADQDVIASENVDRCLIGNLDRVRQGFPLYMIYTRRAAQAANVIQVSPRPCVQTSSISCLAGSRVRLKANATNATRSWPSNISSSTNPSKLLESIWCSSAGTHLVLGMSPRQSYSLPLGIF